MWGEALMISPVLTEGAVQVDAVIPKGRWYDYYTVSISHIWTRVKNFANMK